MKKKVADLYTRYVGAVVKVVGIALVLSVLFQILARYLPGNGFRWTEELARLLFLWFCFLGAALALVHDGHLGIDYFYGKMGEKAQIVLDFAATICVLAFSGLIAFYGYKLVILAHLQRSPIMRVPMSLFYSAVPVGTTLFIIYELAALYDMTKGIRLHQSESSTEEGKK